VNRLRQIDPDFHTNVPAVARMTAFALSSSPETGAPKEAFKNRSEVSEPSLESSVWIRAHVVPPTLIRVRQDCIRFAYLFEAFLGLRVAPGDVWVMFTREPAVSLFDCFGIGIPGHAQNVVMIWHQDSPSL
jgi:hypothetical protein